ncbi:Gfo/Idh/MocA family oxidoreductase [Microbulbifer sp. EKSA008]|uniref:Gfo/Idh/MocA family oxidoreductase n=1 Tax=unclassified Microbulbifer TaxID=2619833 RepID=UPI004039D64F
MGIDNRKRVVVAGTGFGRIYLEALTSSRLPGREHFELSGLLARGSDYSRSCAEQYGVPLYTEAEQVPDDIDIVCVVVRSGATGGEGSEIAQSFLKRGIHVLQEHPVHTKEITANLLAAKQGNSAYAVNTLYPNLRPTRQFLAAAEYLRRHQRLEMIDAICNSQMAYPLLDVIGRAVGGLRPWSFSEPVQPEGHPFQSLSATFGGVPMTLRIQNQVHPQDPDNHSLLLHRLAIGGEAGVLTLTDTHGPVLWNPRLHSPRDQTGRLILKGEGTERLAVPSMVTLGDTEMRSYHDIFALTWPEAVIEALHSLCTDIAQPEKRKQSGQWALSVSMAWSDLTARIGMPTLIQPGEPEPVSVQALADIVGQACD